MLFYCSFLALRSEDPKSPIEYKVDFDIDKEREQFAG